MRRTLLTFAWALAVLLLAGVIWADLEYDWTARSSFTSPLTTAQSVERQKTIWDWLDLLLIPLVLTAGGLWFSWQDRMNERAIADRRIKEDRAIAERRTQEDRYLAEQRAEKERELADINAQEAALQAYLEQMSVLLIDKGLRQSSPEDEARAVARAWTLTVLRRVKGERKGAVVRFLYESGLITQGGTIVSLVGADLRDAYLGSADLHDANLAGLELIGAELSEANLANANLARASLGFAALNGTNLSAATLMETNLMEASLSSANLSNANLMEARLFFTFLHLANLVGANLTRASLLSVNLQGADLTGADLTEAYLGGSDLRDAILTGANLQGSKYNGKTQWPEGFDPQAAGAILIED